MTTPTTVLVQLKLRSDTAANWTSANPTLLAGELGRETDTGKIKIGTGSTAWTALAYQPFGAPITNADISATAEIAVSKLADGTARQLLQTDAAGTGVEWASDIDIPGTLDVTGAATFDNAVTITGDLTVNGTTTNINTTNLVVEDKNIILGDVATPSDVTADGGGITLKGATDKTINWVNATDAWTSSERFSVPLGSTAAPSLTITGNENTGLWSPGANQLAISTNAIERARIDSSGRLLLGLLIARSNYQGTSSAGLQLEGPSTINTNIAAIRRGATPSFYLGRQNGAANGDNDIVGTNQGLGIVHFLGADGAALLSAASIVGSTDATPGLGSMPGRLVLSTTSTGTSAPVERLRIDSVGTTTLTSSASTAPFIANIGASEVARIDSSGRLLVGTSSGRGVSTTSQASLQIENSEIASTFIRNTADQQAPVLSFGKTRGTSSGSLTTVILDSGLGQIRFCGADGTNFIQGARIDAFVDGTPGTNDMPGRLVFSTTADGASSPTERLRITNDGVMCYDQAAPVSYAAAATLVIGDLKNGLVQYTGGAATLTLPTGTLTEDGFSGVYINMTFEWSVINTGSGTCTIGNGTGHTVTGSATVAAGASARFASRRTAANTFVSYRLS